jgi:hypothetical protein
VLNGVSLKSCVAEQSGIWKAESGHGVARMSSVVVQMGSAVADVFAVSLRACANRANAVLNALALR